MIKVFTPITSIALFSRKFPMDLWIIRKKYRMEPRSSRGWSGAQGGGLGAIGGACVGYVAGLDFFFADACDG